MSNQIDRKLGKTLREDFKRGDFRRTVRRDFKELKEFFLDDQRRDRLANMGWFKRWFFMFVWLLKSLFLKLTPARRLLLLAGVVLILISGSTGYQGEDVQFNSDSAIAGGLFILFVLMLELKDKLLAHQELETGRAVQRALMPEESPEMPGWSLWLFTRPANDVGGDLVDFQRMYNDRFGAALGDVAGKGLGAALFMARLQATLRALSPDFRSLAELGAKLNQIFYRDGLANKFASLVYLDFQSQSALVRVLNAGHFPPLVIKSDGTIEEMSKGAMALGISANAAYTEQEIALAGGDLLLIYSDGVTEARNTDGEFFGEQRLREMLPALTGMTPKQAGEIVLTEVDRFIDDARANDDLSLVVLKRE
ncbi:MAG: PP2C family protein-serine/threonine phosphatase [bacterium]